MRYSASAGFAGKIAQAVGEGSLAYAGMSAGASLVTADLVFYEAPDDPGAVETTAGLGLIGFFPLVHANRGRQERYARLIAAYGDRYEFVPINDDEAVVVVGETWQRRASAVAAPSPHSRS